MRWWLCRWLLRNTRTMSSVCLTFSKSGLYVSELVKTGEVDDRGMYVFQWSEDQKYATYLQSHPSGFRDMGRVGVSEKYISHLMKFSHMVKSNHSFADVMRAASQVSPSLKYYLLSEYGKRNAGNISQKVKDQWVATNKELKDVIRFPKETNGKSNPHKQG